LNTYPVSLITRSKEVIFFNHDSTDEIKAFAEISKLDISNRLDVWEIICRPSLDTEAEVFDTEYATLSSYGITRKEVDEIRNKIWPNLWMTMEWQYLGHWDVLMVRQQHWGLLGRIFNKRKADEFYWWTMEIATRGLNI
jgi:hypothetical protein